MDFLRECHAEELDSIQTLGGLFSSFLARRLQPLVLSRTKTSAATEKDEIGVTPIPHVHIVKASEEETNRDVRMKCHEVGWAFSPLLIISCMRYTVRIKADLPCVLLHENESSFLYLIL